jgi:hypothetical protein
MLLYMFSMPGEWLHVCAKAVCVSFVTFTTLALGDLVLSGAGWRVLFEAGHCDGYL